VAKTPISLARMRTFLSPDNSRAFFAALEKLCYLPVTLVTTINFPFYPTGRTTRCEFVMS
jgi:hypothetical protein